MNITLNKEAFIAVEDFDVNLKVKVTNSMEDLHDYLICLEPNDNPDTKVIHGVITEAKYIPGDIKNQKCFLMVLEPGCTIDSLDLEGIIIESDSGGDSDVLADEIEDLIENPVNLMCVPNIEEIYIIYGYTMEIGLCVNMDTVDEECVDTCEGVAAEAASMRR